MLEVTAVHDTFVAKAKSDFTTLDRMILEREKAVCQRLKLAAEEDQQRWHHEQAFRPSCVVVRATPVPLEKGGLVHSTALPPAFPLTTALIMPQDYLMQLGLPPLTASSEEWAEHIGANIR